MKPGPPSHRSRWLIRGFLFVFLLGLVFILGSINVPFLQPDEASEVLLLYVFSTFVFLTFVIYGLILIRYLVRMYAERRRRVLGAQFKTKMVAGALTLSLLPVLALFFLSYSLLNRTLDKWFPRPLEIVRDDALYMVQHLLEEHELHALEQAQDLAKAPALRAAIQTGDETKLQTALDRVAADTDLEWVAWLNPLNEHLAVYRSPGSRTDLLTSIPILLGPPEKSAYTTTEELSDRAFSIARVRLEDSGETLLGTLLVAQPLEGTLLAKKREIEIESQNYGALAQQRKAYRWQALLILLLVTTLILLASTWLALFLAKEVTVPIQALAEATEEVSHGNFSHRVEVPARDELATLVSSFNSMTHQLGESLRAREEALTELDRRRQWMETLLESLPTGVLTVSNDLHVLRSNQAARFLLDWKEEESEGLPLHTVLPPQAAELCSELFTAADRGGQSGAQMDFPFQDRIAHIAVTVSALRRGAENQGYVVVLDDLSDLLKAQKAAAWQEVAQRIAHEIKNPLTPIQLSADRIRSYATELLAVPSEGRQRRQDLILQCAGTIAAEVHSLKNLVDEFSQFARFPVVRPVPTGLNHVVESTLALYPPANGISLRTKLAEALPTISADPELLRRVVANLLRNATEAVAQQPEGSRDILIQTRPLPGRESVELTVADSGTGIPPENKEGLFLPFFSTKPDGMGLGLAIVGRIVSEHQGTIRVEDNQPRGTRFIIELPTASRTVAV